MTHTKKNVSVILLVYQKAEEPTYLPPSLTQHTPSHVPQGKRGVGFQRTFQLSGSSKRSCNSYMYVYVYSILASAFSLLGFQERQEGRKRGTTPFQTLASYEEGRIDAANSSQSIKKGKIYFSACLLPRNRLVSLSLFWGYT